jgi:hypothetical protein
MQKSYKKEAYTPLQVAKINSSRTNQTYPTYQPGITKAQITKRNSYMPINIAKAKNK